MNKKTIRLGAVALIAGLSIASLTACANVDEEKAESTQESVIENDKPTPTTTPEVIGKDTISPVQVELMTLNGSVVDAPVGGFVYIQTGSIQVDAVTGIVADENVAKFVSGSITDGVTTTPGLTDLKKGSTQVTLEDGSGNTIIFTLVVSERV